MSHTESVRFVLKEKKFREVSKGRGVIDYHLVDEHGNNRTVSAMANLGWGNKIRSVRPVHHRELPLIQVLVKTRLNQPIVVNFSEFNKKYPRGSIRTSKVSVAKVKVNPKDAQFITSMSSMAEHKGRLMQLFGFSFATFGMMMVFVHNS